MPILGVVPYLNALPLYRTLEASGTPILRAVPARLSARLADGECDAALIPIVDFLRGVGEAIISDACIGSDGAVRSVLLFHRAPVEELTRVAVDTSSHTSVALLRVLLADFHEVQPELVPRAPQWNELQDTENAVLLIGDRALEAVAPALAAGWQILDLGAAWKAATGLPFVFAAWVARRGLPATEHAELAAVLHQARDDGMSELPLIVRDNPIPTPLSSAEIEDYLRHAVEFHLTDRHRAGLDEFRRRCERHGLLR